MIKRVHGTAKVPRFLKRLKEETKNQIGGEGIADQGSRMRGMMALYYDSVRNNLLTVHPALCFGIIHI